MKASVILPTYNEAGNIVELIQDIIFRFPTDWEYEIVVVDDNSPDNTFQLVVDTFKDNPAILAEKRLTDRGLAKSIRAGIEMSHGDQIIVMDTDFTHDPIEIPKLLHISRVYDIVSGSRFCSGGNMYSKRHYIASLLYNWLLRIILRTQIQDNLGGYFTISKQSIQRLPIDRIFTGYGDYFFKLLDLAQKEGLTIVEIPSKYRARYKGSSKSNFFRMLFLYSFQAVKFKYQESRAAKD